MKVTECMDGFTTQDLIDIRVPFFLFARSVGVGVGVGVAVGWLVGFL